MKKKYCLIIMLMSVFLSVGTVSAKSSYTCSREVAPGENIKCSVTVDSDPVTIESDGNIKVYSINGNKFSKLDSYRVLFQESGTVYFGPADDKYAKYIISLYGEEGVTSYLPDIRVSVISKTTTTTTTTTKKRSSNNNLLSITVNNEKIEDFSKNETRYYLTYPNDVTKAVFKVEKEDETSRVEFDGPDFLKVGDNEYTISVTSEDDSTKFYKVIITRQDVDKSSNTNISNIKIKGYKLKITSNAKTYYLTVKKDTKSLDIKVKTEDENAKYKIVGNKKLKDGSTVKIIVTAENNDKETYRIIINKEKNSIVPYVLMIAVLLIIIVVVTIIIIKKRKKKNKPDKNVDKHDDKSNNNNDKDDNDDENSLEEDLEKTKEVKIEDDKIIVNEADVNDDEEC